MHEFDPHRTVAEIERLTRVIKLAREFEHAADLALQAIEAETEEWTDE